MLKLVSNKIRCKFCGDILESFTVHDFKRCRCGKCSTDGGHEYAQRSFFTEKPEDTYEDLSIYVDENGKLVNAKDADKKNIPLKPIQIEVKEVHEASDAVQVIEERDGKTYYLVSSKIIHPAEDELLKATIEEEPDIPKVIEEQSDEPKKKPTRGRYDWNTGKAINEE